MESMHYKILDFLHHQPQKQMKYSELHKHFQNMNDDELQTILSENLGNKVTYSLIDENNDFIIAMTSEGSAAYQETKYSDLINTRLLWKNRIISFVLGVLTAVIAEVITKLLFSESMLQNILQLLSK